jgi:predicted alpha/beta hydrolase family esterase
VPRFPTPRKQSLANWLAALGKDAERLNEKTILVGHSAGCAFALRLLEKTKPDCKVKIRAVFLVAPFARFLGDARFDAPNRTFLNKPFNWRKIRASARRFVVFASRDDPYVPIVQARFVARKLGAELIVVKNAGHFNKAAGYTSFPALLEKIKKISGV